MTRPEDVARQVVSDRLDEVAARMDVGRRAAPKYVNDDMIADLAAEVLGINDFVPLEQARGAVVVSVVVVPDSGDETDADPETSQQHRGGDRRPPWVARSGGEQRQR